MVKRQQEKRERERERERLANREDEMREKLLR